MATVKVLFLSLLLRRGFASLGYEENKIVVIKRKKKMKKKKVEMVMANIARRKR